MSRAPLNIESILERIGSVEKPEDPVHRYELRRELLCSRFFQAHCVREERRSWFVTFTAPLITGGILVVVFAFVGSSMLETTQVDVLSQPAVVVHVVATDENKIAQEFIDARAPVPMYEVLQFAPVETVDYTLMR